MTLLRRLGRGGAAAAAAPAPSVAAEPAARRALTLDVLFSPYVIAIALFVPLLITFLAIPADVYEEHYSARKYASPGAVVFYALAIAVFAVGAVVGDLLAQRPGSREARSLSPGVTARLRAVVIGALVVAIAAHVLWIGLAVWRAGGIGSLIAEFGDDPLVVKYSRFATIPGITTLTQAGLAAVPLAIAFRLVGRGLVGALSVAAVALALSISILASQRLAVLELGVAIGYLVLAGRRASFLRIVAVAATAGAALVAFFVFAEVRRRGAYTTFSIVDALELFSGYYLNSLNNAFAMIEHYSFAVPLYYTTAAFWELPGVSALGLHYQDVFAVSGAELEDNFHREFALSRSSTTFGVPGATSVELGWSALLLILGIGAASGALYRAGRRDAFYRAVYAVWLVGVLEFTRIYYFFQPRLVPTYVVFAVAFFVLRRARADALQRAPARGGEA